MIISIVENIQDINDKMHEAEGRFTQDTAKALKQDNPSKNILIFGATGLIGEHITNAILVNKEKFGRIGVFTSSNTVWTKSDEIEELKKQGAEIIAGDVKSKSDVNEAYLKP